jgi:hypothetical protein
MNRMESRVTNSPSPSNVSMKIVQRTNQTLVMELRNDSNHAIFLSYEPPSRGTAATFLTYSLEKRTARENDFRVYGEAFHHVPNLHPINARSVSFRLISYPTEKGEYRAKVGYYEDEEVYKMVSERLLEMTDAEREKGPGSLASMCHRIHFLCLPRTRRGSQSAF